jgi:hypothetical protein
MLRSGRILEFEIYYLLVSRFSIVYIGSAGILQRYATERGASQRNQRQVKNPMVPRGVLAKKKPFWQLIPALPNAAFRLFHVNQEVNQWH